VYKNWKYVLLVCIFGSLSLFILADNVQIHYNIQNSTDIPMYIGYSEDYSADMVSCGPTLLCVPHSSSINFTATVGTDDINLLTDPTQLGDRWHYFEFEDVIWIGNQNGNSKGVTALVACTNSTDYIGDTWSYGGADLHAGTPSGFDNTLIWIRPFGKVSVTSEFMQDKCLYVYLQIK